MGIFDKFKASMNHEPEMRIAKQGKNSRTLDFSEFMNSEMKKRIRNGELEWMDKVVIFEDFYVPKRESQGWILIGGSKLSSSTEDRFKATWQEWIARIFQF